MFVQSGLFSASLVSFGPWPFGPGFIDMTAVTPGTFASSTDSFPDEATTDAGTSDTTPPFATTFSAISPGQTLYVSAFAYDLNGIRSGIAQTAIEDPATANVVASGINVAVAGSQVIVDR